MRFSNGRSGVGRIGSLRFPVNGNAPTPSPEAASRNSTWVTGGGRRVWCNARLSAAGFYERVGFGRVGGVFEIAGIGPHAVMTIAAGPANR